LSREVLLVLVFFGFALWALSPSASTARDWLLPASGLVMIIGMARVYMLRTVPVWNRATTPLKFLATGLTTGGLLTVALIASVRWQEYALVAWTALAVVLAFEVHRRSRFYGSYRRLGV
jgi:DMSO reductase anchor subunit